MEYPLYDYFLKSDLSEGISEERVLKMFNEYKTRQQEEILVSFIVHYMKTKKKLNINVFSSLGRSKHFLDVKKLPTDLYKVIVSCLAYIYHDDE